MDERKPKGKPEAVPKGTSSGEEGRGGTASDAAFDIWLQRGLHQMFDDVMREPIPDELLRLIQQDRDKG